MGQDVGRQHQEGSKVRNLSFSLYSFPFHITLWFVGRIPSNSPWQRCENVDLLSQVQWGLVASNVIVATLMFVSYDAMIFPQIDKPCPEKNCQGDTEKGCFSRKLLHVFR